METIKNLFNEEVFAQRFKPNGKRASNEYGDAMKELSQLTGYPIPRLGEKLKGMNDIHTLYYLISSVKDLVRTGKKKSYLHAFNSILFVEK